MFKYKKISQQQVEVILDVTLSNVKQFFFFYQKQMVTNLPLNYILFLNLQQLQNFKIIEDKNYLIYKMFKLLTFFLLKL